MEIENVRAKTVLVTGASRGIGEEIATKFAENGYNVVINYLSSETKAQALAEKLTRFGVRTLLCRADVADPVQVKIMVREALDVFGHIDVLVNNAGQCLNKLLIDCKPKDIEDCVLTNLMGAIYVTKEVLPSMIDNLSGKIINIASMWGTAGGSMESVYSATKGGIIAFTKATAKEFGLSGINVNCVSPGVIMTDMIKNLSVDDLRELQAETALNRIGQPKDIAGVVYFLATDDASYITGANIPVDGGR